MGFLSRKMWQVFFGYQKQSDDSWQCPRVVSAYPICVVLRMKYNLQDVEIQDGIVLRVDFWPQSIIPVT